MRGEEGVLLTLSDASLTTSTLAQHRHLHRCRKLAGPTIFFPIAIPWGLAIHIGPYLYDPLLEVTASNALLDESFLDIPITQKEEKHCALGDA